MMKRNILAVVIPALLAASAANAAEIYNKTAISWICMVKLSVCTTSLITLATTVITLTFVSASKAKPRSTIS